MRALAVLPFIAVTAAGYCCINDRDTLGFELRNRPNVQRALTGRFDRFPPTYYEMRIKRLEALPKLTPKEIDDLAVAYERLDKSDEAIRIIERKKGLPNLTKDDRYRYHANRGTFLAHRWIHRGAKASELDQLKEAEKDIVQAIKINPDAHSGREGVQLETMRWLRQLRTNPKETKHLGPWLMDRMKKVEVDKSLAGLIMLGSAWESPDVALAIAHYQSAIDQDAVRDLAFLRYQELVGNGKKSFAPELAAREVKALEEEFGNSTGPREPSVKDRYEALRDEADEWHTKKTAYMSALFAKGRHPDIDTGFWGGWSEPNMPKLQHRLPKPFFIEYAVYIIPLILLAILALPITGIVLWLRLRKRRAALTH